MNKQQFQEFWVEVMNDLGRVDRLQLVYADGIYNYDANRDIDLLKIADMVFAKAEDVEVRVNAKRFVTFIMTMDDKIFDL